MVRDIRELTDSPEAYAAELRRRWGGLLSYRYIGRSYASMDLGPDDNTVTLRRDMLTPVGARTPRRGDAFVAMGSGRHCDVDG
jgi:hypothetical protein